MTLFLLLMVAAYVFGLCVGVFAASLCFSARD